MEQQPIVIGSLNYRRRDMYKDFFTQCHDFLGLQWFAAAAAVIGAGKSREKGVVSEVVSAGFRWLIRNLMVS